MTGLWKGRRPRGTRGRLPGLLLVLLSVALILLPGPNTARANTLTPVDDVLSAVGGNVYISRTPNGDTGQFWADGAWHDFAELDPADKDTQDGPSVSIGNGWYISWDHAKYGGTYLVWRYPDGGQLTYAGSTWPGFKVRLNNIGYTSTGERIDSIIDFTSVYAWQANGLNEPGWFTPFEISRIYGPLAAAESNDDDAAAVGVDATFTTTLVRTGTETPIDPDNRMDIVYWDIDQPVHHTPDGARTRDFASEWREGVHLVSGYKDEVVIGRSTDLIVSDDNTWFRSGAEDPSSTPTNRSTIVAKAGPQYTTQWRGESCSTGIGYDSKVTVYPEWTDPVKSPPRQIRRRGETASFDITQTFPHVADSNRADSIIMTDTLDAALDASQATVTVRRDGVDVTDNWDIQISGQTITATAKNTGHGYAESEHVFTITAPVSPTADLSEYERGDIGSDRYWTFPNTAAITINGVEKRTNAVDVLVPYEATGSIQIGATKRLLGGVLADGQFGFELRDADGTVLDTRTNDADGAVTFTDIEYTQDDIGKTYTYTIVEKNDAAQEYVYDTHAETVTVTVEDAGRGRLTATAAYDADGAVFTNERKVPLALVKRSSAGDSTLADAQFTLYVDDGDGVFDDDDQPATVYSDPGLHDAIPGAAVTTGADGRAVWRGLSANTSYWLRETRAPAGFNLDSTPHPNAVSELGEVTTTGADGQTAALPVVDGIATITIADDPIPALPRAAGPGTTRLVFAGAFLLVSGIGVALLRRRPARVPNRG